VDGVSGQADMCLESPIAIGNRLIPGLMIILLVAESAEEVPAPCKERNGLRPIRSG
jgi:hypothetical protein